MQAVRTYISSREFLRLRVVEFTGCDAWVINRQVQLLAHVLHNIGSY